MILRPDNFISLFEKHRVDDEIDAEDMSISVQPNGLDLRIIDIFLIAPFCVHLRDDNPKGLPCNYAKEQLKWGKHRDVHIYKSYSYEIKAHVYFEHPILEGVAAYIIGRSTFARCGLLIRSSLYDTGYKGEVGAYLYAFNDATIQKFFRFGQMVFIKADNCGVYDGQYQYGNTTE